LRIKALQVCKLLESNAFEECWSVAAFEYYYARCMRDYCMRGDASDQPLCTHAAALARECALEGIYIDWRKHPLAVDKCCKLLYSLM